MKMARSVLSIFHSLVTDVGFHWVCALEGKDPIPSRLTPVVFTAVAARLCTGSSSVPGYVMAAS